MVFLIITLIIAIIALSLIYARPKQTFAIKLAKAMQKSHIDSKPVMAIIFDVGVPTVDAWLLGSKAPTPEFQKFILRTIKDAKGWDK